MFHCDCEGIPGEEGQKRRNQTIRAVPPREILAFSMQSNSRAVMIIRKALIPEFDFASMDLGDSASIKKQYAKMLFSYM